MRNIYITSPVPIVNLTDGVVDHVIEVNPEIMYRLWSKFLNDLNKIAVSIYLALINSNSKCLESRTCRARLLTDVIVAFMKHLITVPLVPPLEQKSIIRHEYILHPQEMSIFYAILRGYCTYTSDDICRLFTLIENLLTSTQSGDLPGVEDLPLHYDRLSEAVVILKKVIGEEAYNLIFNVLDVLEENHTEVCRNEEVYRLGLLRCVPADTRPGLNTSSLITHMLLTSAIAYLIKIQSETSHDLGDVIIRLAGILHDIGKPIAWYKTFTKGHYVSHVNEEVLDEVWTKLGDFKKLLDAEVWSYVRAIVRCHHENESGKCIEGELKRFGVNVAAETIGMLTKLSNYIIQADRISSNTDRIESLILSVLKDIESRSGVSEEELKEGYKESPNAWYWWLRRSDEDVRKIAKAITEVVISEDAQMRLSDHVKELSVVKHVNIGIIDIRGIQEYINRETFRALIGGSIAVDITTLAIIPSVLIKVLGLNLEHILYAGGGTVEVLIPQDGRLENVFKKYYSNLMKRALWLPAISCAEVSLKNDWRVTSRELISTLAAVKLVPARTDRDNIKLTELRVGMVCEVCGREPAKKLEGKEVYSDYLMCDVCNALWNFGENFYVRSKLELLRSVGYGEADKLLEEVKSGKLMKYLMEWLSGSTEWFRGEGTNIATIKADMNLGGLFMANSLSISEAFTKSVLIDYALKKSLYIALEAIKDVYGRDKLIRTFVGIMYAGGDDLLMIAPAGISPLLTLYATTVFWSIIGSRQLSIAIGVAKPKQNVWNVIDTTTEFLKISKDYIRSKVRKLSDLINIVGILSIAYSDKQLLPAYADVLERYEVQGLTTQPLILKVSNGNGFQFARGMNVFTQLLTLFTDDRINSVKDLIGSVYQGSNIPCLDRSYVGEVIDYVREVYTASRSKSRSRDELLLTIAVYSVNYDVKLRKSEYEVSRIFSEKLGEFLQSIFSELERERKLPLYDLYLLAKLLEEEECVNRGSKV